MMRNSAKRRRPFRPGKRTSRSRGVRCAACVALCALLSSCRGQFFPEARNLSDYKLISVVGLDVGERAEDGVALTLSAKEQVDSKLGGGKSGGSGEAGDRPLVLTNEARSVALAYQEMQSYTQEYLFLGHVQYFLMGETAAREGIARYLDFLRRDPDSRYLARLYIVKDATARDMATKASTNANYIADRLNALESQVGVLSTSHALNLAQVAGRLEGAHGHMLLPLIKLSDPSAHDASIAPQTEEQKTAEPKDKEQDKKEDGEEDEENEKEDEQENGNQGGQDESGQADAPDKDDAEKATDKEAAPEGPGGMPRDMDVAGYAVIVRGRMVDTIETDLSPAVNFLQNTMNSQIMEIDVDGGATAALRILNSRGDVKPLWNGDQLTGLEIVIKAEAALNENQSGAPVAGGAETRPLAGQLEDWVETRLAAVLSQAQRLGADYLGIGARIEKKHPVRFDGLADDWDRVFAQLPVAVRADVSVVRTYEINS